MSARRQWAWSVRRELWENRSLYVAPMLISVIVLIGAIGHINPYLARVVAGSSTAQKQLYAVVTPYGLAAAAVLFIAWIAAVFYCLDALNGERRDRSILFWKSMPVSDLTTVLAKFTVPMLAVPVIAIVIALATQIGISIVHTVAMMAKGIDPALLWAVLPPQMPVGMVYGMFVHSLWFAPVFAYLLLVSSIVPRAPFLWAFVPVFGAYAIETIFFSSQHVLTFLKYRMIAGTAFKPDAMKTPITHVSQLDPARFFSNPDLWLGLALAAAFIAIAVRQRRYRDPT